MVRPNNPMEGAAVEFHERSDGLQAADIVHSELGLGLSQRKTQKLISKSRITDLRNGGQHSYVSARRLFRVIRELQAVPRRINSRSRSIAIKGAVSER